MLKTLSRIGRELEMKVDVLEPIARCLFNEEEEDEFMQFFYRRNCAAAVMSCAISSTGNMRPCIHSDTEFGNVLENGLLAVWRKMDSWTSHKMLPKECQSCPAVVICEGGCRMAAKLINGSYDARDMYMVGPIKDLDRIAKLPKNEDKQIISDSCRLHCNNACKLRKEEFGYIAMSDRGVYFISESAREFIEYLKNLGSFTVKDLLTEGYREEEVIPIMSNLLKSNILEYESEVIL
jgi:radical SAM protein with 4Fe4S-binding SPASM domain